MKNYLEAVEEVREALEQDIEPLDLLAEVLKDLNADQYGLVLRGGDEE